MEGDSLPMSSVGPRGTWILHLKVLKLRDWVLGDRTRPAFPLLIVPTKLFLAADLAV